MCQLKAEFVQPAPTQEELEWKILQSDAYHAILRRAMEIEATTAYMPSNILDTFERP